MPALLPPFTLLSADTFDLSARSWADNERALLAAIPSAEQGIALIHEGGDGIVVPRSYPQGKPAFQAACHTLAAEGLQVHLQTFGGQRVAGCLESGFALWIAARHHNAVAAFVYQRNALFGRGDGGQQGAFVVGPRAGG